MKTICRVARALTIALFAAVALTALAPREAVASGSLSVDTVWVAGKGKSEGQETHG
ncbi:MAG TPA: hypothetical protein VLH79_06275 [Chthonomonadales bacterium]|nr:hypothetical protein [Chthonomonadales bacterium]